MYFTSGSDRAFEQLMQGKPGFDHYDSGEAVTPEDCGTCRFYRPHWKYQFCVYAECPYQSGKLTAYDAVTFRVKGVENMAVFRVERNKGYTVMSNHHLRNKDLSLKAKGLLSQMLSLPEDWDYTLKGLSLINREQIDAIRAAIRELEQAGYIVRSRERDSQGRLRGADYVIYEQPQPVPDSPTFDEVAIPVPKGSADTPSERGIEIYLVRAGIKKTSGGEFTWYFNVDCPTSPFVNPNIKLTAQLKGSFTTLSGSYSNVGGSVYHTYTSNSEYGVDYTWTVPAKTGYYYVAYTITDYDNATSGSGVTTTALSNRTGHAWNFNFSDSVSGKSLPMPPANYAKGATTTRPSNLADTYYNTYTANTGVTLNRSLYDVHHIRPLAYGGSNAYSNLIHLPKATHTQVTSWWAGY